MCFLKKNKQKLSWPTKEKVVRCVICGNKLENNSLEAQMKHYAATSHRLYTEEIKIGH